MSSHPSPIYGLQHQEEILKNELPASPPRSLRKAASEREVPSMPIRAALPVTMLTPPPTRRVSLDMLSDNMSYLSSRYLDDVELDEAACPPWYLHPC